MNTLVASPRESCYNKQNRDVSTYRKNSKGVLLISRSMPFASTQELSPVCSLTIQLVPQLSQRYQTLYFPREISFLSSKRISLPQLKQSRCFSLMRFDIKNFASRLPPFREEYLQMLQAPPFALQKKDRDRRT